MTVFYRLPRGSALQQPYHYVIPYVRNPKAYRYLKVPSTTMSLQPTNSLVNALLTDMYQLSMAYAYWQNGRHNNHAVFDLFFRKPPFKGEYCIFAGLDEALRFISSFKFTKEDIEYLKSIMKGCEEGYFDWLLTLNTDDVKVYAMAEGSVVFAKEPLMRVEGPLAVCQLLETTLLNLVNYPSLITTNAARMRLAAGPDKGLLEFGLRRAQGPDGGVSASKYSYMGGFNGTSNVLAGKLFGMDVKGTHAHSFVMSYTGLNDLNTTTIRPAAGGEPVEFAARVVDKKKTLGYHTNEGELASFIAYAQSFPGTFLALVDTYDTLNSGVKNFLCVGWVLWELGYKPLGVRLDSGDLAYLSRATRKMFVEFDAKYMVQEGAGGGEGGAAASSSSVFSACSIVASNDINETVLNHLNHEGHEINTFGIGTHLVTCQSQPALGCVYKLVEINKVPRIKLSQELQKLVIPGRKVVYRLFGQEGKPLLDLMMLEDEAAPMPGERILARHPFAEQKRAYVQPSAVKRLLTLAFDGALRDRVRNAPDLTAAVQVAAAVAAAAAPTSTGIDSTVPSSFQGTGIVDGAMLTLEQCRALCVSDLASLRSDHLRAMNPTPYKLSVSQNLFDFIHKLWMDEAPIADLK